VKIALVRGKTKYDRREDVKRKDMDRDIQRELKERTRE
jgi:tmRNA-binding protein